MSIEKRLAPTPLPLPLVKKKRRLIQRLSRKLPGHPTSINPTEVENYVRHYRNRDLMQLVRENAGHIFRNIVLSDGDPVCFSVNFPQYPSYPLTLDLLHEQMNVVYNITRGKFRVNVGFTRHKVMAELKLFKGEHDKECVLY